MCTVRVRFAYAMICSLIIVRDVLEREVITVRCSHCFGVHARACALGLDHYALLPLRLLLLLLLRCVWCAKNTFTHILATVPVWTIFSIILHTMAIYVSVHVWRVRQFALQIVIAAAAADAAVLCEQRKRFSPN